MPIDNRAYNTTDVPCSCIPAIDNPQVSNAEEATWLQDNDIVFGIEVNGEYRDKLKRTGAKKTIYTRNVPGHKVVKRRGGISLKG